jgi:hypothetical protein
MLKSDTVLGFIPARNNPREMHRAQPVLRDFNGRRAVGSLEGSLCIPEKSPALPQCQSILRDASPAN